MDSYHVVRDVCLGSQMHELNLQFKHEPRQMPPKKKVGRTGASESPEQARISRRDALASNSPAVSEQWSSPGLASVIGESSVSPAQAAAGKKQKGNPAAVRLRPSGGQGKGATVHAAAIAINKKRNSKAVQEPSPQSDQDFAELSRGRTTTGTRRRLMSSINKLGVSASMQAVAGSTAVVAGVPAPPHKRAPTPSHASDAAPCSMADMRTQDAHGQASAPDMEFRV